MRAELLASDRDLSHIESGSTIGVHATSIGFNGFFLLFNGIVVYLTQMTDSED